MLFFDNSNQNRKARFETKFYDAWPVDWSICEDVRRLCSFMSHAAKQTVSKWTVE